MIKNYIKIAFRNLWRHKSFSLINIIGLAVGMAAFMLIIMYVSFELSYDNFHENRDQIYRLNVDIKSSPTETMKLGVGSAPMGPTLKADFPEILESTRLFGGGMLIKVNNQLFQENSVFYAEPSIFKVFSLQMVKGDASRALKDPYSMVITESTAKKYFGSADPIGKTILVENKYPSTVTAVIKDIPNNSQLKCDMLYSVSTLEKMYQGRLEQWGNFGNFTYLLLSKGTDAAKLQAKFPAFLKKHISENDRKNGEDYALFIEPLKDAYMDTRQWVGESGNISNVRIFTIVALFILIIAAINFINLTTARAVERAKEVGIRKVIGAIRYQLTTQFLGESIIICLISFVFAAGLVSLMLPMFNQLAGKEICSSIFSHGYIFILLLISLLIGVAAGTYPALTLSGFKPIVVLKGRFSTSTKGTLLRKGLVVFQFTISIILIVGTLIVYNQLSYMRNQPLGFEKNEMLTLNFGGDESVHKNFEEIKNEFRSIPNVLAATISSGIPGSGNPNAHSDIENKDGNMQPTNINMYDVDYDFIPTYGIKIVAGRAFSTSFATDSTKSIVINEAAAKSLGYTSPKQAIGKKFSQWGREGLIVGVMKDFHYRSLQSTVDPLNFRINPSNTWVFTLKISAQNIPATIAAIQNKWKVLIPQRPFDYSFVDDTFNKQYATEDRFGKLFMYFSVLAIFISCLGLLGLASYSTLQRTREIGIRKVMGASIFGIVNMLSKEFLLLVIIAAVIAFPLSWIGMNKWLQDFAYRIDIGWWVFAVAGLLSLMIAISTVSFQAIKAALMNPVKSLRSE
jgi:putative ABC transport system permease protein